MDDRKYTMSKLNFSADEEELSKVDIPTNEAVREQPDGCSQDESQSQECEMHESDEEDEEYEEHADDEHEGEDEDVQHEVTLLKEASPPTSGLVKPIINQNLNLNRAYEKKMNQYPATPAIIKRKQTKAWFNSPTDACLSPCTQKIFKSRKPLN